MSCTILTVQVDASVNERLERLAKSTGRTRDTVAAELINGSLDVYEWQVEGIQQAISSFDRGESISHNEVSDWVASRGSPTDKPVPGSTPRTVAEGGMTPIWSPEAIADLVALMACSDVHCYKICPWVEIGPRRKSIDSTARVSIED